MRDRSKKRWLVQGMDHGAMEGSMDGTTMDHVARDGSGSNGRSDGSGALKDAMDVTSDR